MTATRPTARGWSHSRRSQAVAVVSGALCAACGYHAVYGMEGPGRLHVKLVRTLVPDSVASDEVAAGVREELAREGSLEPGDGWPRAEIEVLRMTEGSEGIAARDGLPKARGVEVGIVGRAWIAAAPDRSPQHDTGDMTAEEVISVDEGAATLDTRASALHRADSRSAAARRLGRKLARRLSGYPAASEDEDR